MSRKPSYSPKKTLFGLLFLAVLVFYPYLRAQYLPRSVEFGGETMGTYYTVKIADSRMSKRRLRALHANTQKLLQEINADLSTYDPASVISRFNSNTNTTPQLVTESLVTVTRHALKLSRETGGAFDPTVRPLVDLWGFYNKQDQPIPAQADIDSARRSVGAHLIQTTGNDALTKSKSTASLDLSASAKGYGVDRILQMLVSADCANVYVDIGGEIRTRGKSPGGSAWRIAIETPVPGTALGESHYLTITVEDRAIASSGDYRNFFQADGKRYSHIIDPRTGYPISNTVAAVSVLAPDCMHADTLATALMVMQPDAGLALIAQHTNTEALIIMRDASGQFQDLRSPNFNAAISD
ncbi:MAG: FAD:protein FMN transferase [Kiritimatiellae bacterium]|nr:FAD:protein FMN transferase [Kiritimatiellia bacterium]